MSNMSVFGYISLFFNAFVEAYNAEEAAAFRQRNREIAADFGLTMAAVGYEAIDSLIKFLVARAAKDTAVVVAGARASYYTRSTFASVEQAYSLWLEIGERNALIFHTVLVYATVGMAFAYALMKVWAEEQVESCIANENAASEEQLSIEGFVPFALLCPVVEVIAEVEPVMAPSAVTEEVEPTVAPSFSSHKAKSLVKSLGSMAKAKAILGSPSRSWASLAADLILFATEGGYSTLEDAVAELKASV